ncbi:sensor histidine kinase [Roseivirga sp. BDSF3-8]|uniref:sensor histidine kinase n=1 Tax=Roseivirga sp. BDSF3-8 TaxID=3241598 RepID=UPI0035321E91
MGLSILKSYPSLTAHPILAFWLNASEENQNMLLLILIASLLLSLTLVVLLALAGRKRNQINKLLEKQRQDLHLVNQELEDKGKLITLQKKSISKNNELISEVYNEHKSLVSVVAHDLKSPLNKIQGLMHVLEMSGPLNEDQKDAIKKIHHVVEGGRVLISDLNSLIYFEDNDVRADYRKLELMPYICGLLNEHESYAWKKKITLTLDKSDCDFTVTTDEKFLTRILDNLISNAIKFSDPDTEVKISCFHEKGTFGIRVIDQGPGISKEDLQQLYKKFKKLSARPTGGESSSGLGLSIVKTLVLKLQGDIFVESEEGKGTQFTIVFPITHQEEHLYSMNLKKEAEN